MTGPVLALNAGSSSLKFALFRLAKDDQLIELYRGTARSRGEQLEFSATQVASGACSAHTYDERYSPELALARLMEWLGGLERQEMPAAVGHRVVHGGNVFDGPARITPEVRESIGKLADLAPLHQPFCLACIDAVTTMLPGLPQVACFDTAFHRSQSSLARLLPLPTELRSPQLVRYGFHGLSYEFVSAVVKGLVDEPGNARVLIAHLGNGASLCALRRGVSVDTSMSFTALDGLVMGTRPGAIDAGLILHLLKSRRVRVEDLEDALYHRSGLLGISGISSDMQVLLESSEPEAALAVNYFVYRAAKEIGAMAAVLGGIDTLVFTGGIGENSAEVRRRICGACAWLGVDLDEIENERGATRISHGDSRVCVLRVPTDEEQMIARHTVAVLT